MTVPGLDRLRATRLGALGFEVAGGYSKHAIGQLSAAVAYRMLFSLVPLLALLFAVIDLALPDETRTKFADWLKSVLPQSEGIASAVDKMLSGATTGSAIATAVAVAALLWAASGIVASLRIAFRVIWEKRGLPYARAKLLDFGLVLVLGVAAILSFGLSLLVHVLTEAGKALTEKLDLGTGATVVSHTLQIASSYAVITLVLGVLYLVLPPVKIRLRTVLLPALLAAAGFQAATAVYAWYLGRFGNYTSIYGPLGVLLGFLLVVYVGAMAVLLGAELVCALSGTRGSAEPGG